MICYDNLTLAEATAIQNELKSELRFDLAENLDFKTVGGADISFNKGSNQFFAAIVILNFPRMTLQGYALAHGISNFPYIPGFLGFREVPSLLKAWDMIPNKPDVLILDGQGILHPRKMGIASHFGVLTKHLTMGCAKKSLFGKYEEPDLQKYSDSPIYGHHEILGYALRTKDRTQPVYVSPGYGLNVSQSLNLICKCMGKYRIPEPTRIAHEIVNQFRTGYLKEGYHKIPQNPELF
ncbi:endonuclease V [Pedobacter montanisoli]|uniref:Endonuclease V n=1 Tax=Pedobacter montanisoli TaxID=2923277 RepID=A0ABS9ZYG4_9SPHI|nr:endonuclease V [Pedobacter montanisoli]MCJ0743353.1 endonuclease V [Pedobacter montanisoli]